MSVQLDHVLVPSKDKDAAAKLLGRVTRSSMGARAGEGPAADLYQPITLGASDFDIQQYRASRASVYVSDSLTIDFIDARGEVPIHHYCFRVSDSEFDAILARIKKAGLNWGANPFGELEHKINTRMGGKGLYFMRPDGHAWEILTTSYARSLT